MTHMETPTPTWWQRVTTFEPALLRAVLAALAVVLASVGVDATDVFGRIDVAWAAVFAIIPLLQGWWTRRAVVPKETVVEQVMRNGEVIAGPANDLASTGVVVRSVDEPVVEEYDLDEPVN